MKEYYFLGFDQGLANSGIAVLKITLTTKNKIKKEIMEYKWLKTKSKDLLPNRLVYIYNELENIFKKYDIKACACEHLWKNDIHKSSGRNKSAGMMSANMTSALLTLLAGIYNTEFRSFVPSTVKKITTGNGRAEKEEMINKVLLEFEIKEKICEHIADAICIANAVGQEFLIKNNII